MLIDTHAHLNLPDFSEDFKEVFSRAFAAGVCVVNVGTDILTSRRAVDLLNLHPQNVYAAVGLHPSGAYDNIRWDLNKKSLESAKEEFDYKAYRELAENSRVIGIGECGLDYYRLPTDDGGAPSLGGRIFERVEKIKLQQKEAFLQQIKLARELGKALIIHCRSSQGTDDAYEDVLEILKTEILGSKLSNLRFEIHSFTGSLEIARKFINLGGFIGLNGIVTFDKTGNMETVVKGVPLERIVLETDSPYLAPVPHRGKRNEPTWVVEVAKKIVEWKGLDFEVVAAQTTVNAKKLFLI